MADSVEIPFANQEGRSAVEQNSREKLVNMFAEVEVSGRKRLIRRQRAALQSVLALAGEKRAIERLNDTHYLVVGSTLYSFDGASTASLGTLESISGRCQIIFNDNGEVGVCDGSQFYCWDGSSLSVVAIPDEQEIATIAYQAGFGILAVKNSGRFYITGSNDFSSVDALDFATAESYPDPIRRVFVDHNEVWLVGSRSAEIWQLSGGTDFPFSPFTNAQMERGTRAAFSLVAEDNTVFWLGDDDVAYRAEGYRPVRVSNHSVERLIAALSEEQRASCDAFVYTDQGHKFITFRFPGALTLQYNIATNFWNVAESFGEADWQVMGSAGHVVDFYLTPKGIARMARGINKDEGVLYRRGGVSSPGDAAGRQIAMTEFVLDCEVGRAPMGADPQVMLRFAPDGESFGNIRTRYLGETGTYQRRVRWANLGVGRRPTVELYVTDDAEFAIVSAYARTKVSMR